MLWHRAAAGERHPPSRRIVDSCSHLQCWL